MPADFTTPLDTIKLEQRMTPRISVNFLPSTYEKTTPHIMPNESPFKNIKNILYGEGIQAKRMRLSSAKAIIVKRYFRRFSGFNSEISFIPINLDNIYPMTWVMIKTIL